MSLQSETLLYHSIFGVTRSDSSMYCATVVKLQLKVQIVNHIFFQKWDLYQLHQCLMPIFSTTKIRNWHFRISLLGINLNVCSWKRQMKKIDSNSASASAFRKCFKITQKCLLLQWNFFLVNTNSWLNSLYRPLIPCHSEFEEATSKLFLHLC